MEIFFNELFIELSSKSELLLRILIASFCGVFIGYERKNRNKEAGLRTHSIVAMASALIMVISKYGFEVGDQSRLSAQVISGIGFLGAGIIFVKNNMVNGLTTAAGIWATSAIGLAIGSGMYYIGIASTLIIVFIQVLFHKDFFSKSEFTKQTLIFTIIDGENPITNIENFLNKSNIQIISIDMEKNNRSSISSPHITFKFHCIIPHKFNKIDFIKYISNNKNILFYKI